MEYTIKQLAGLSGITVRTLHHYDQIGLLCPKRDEENGYRVYGSEEADRLWQILLYRELGFTLKEIENILNAPDFVREDALKKQLEQLIQKRVQTEQMIISVQKTICAMEGGNEITDEEKFVGIKKSVIETNERVFGHEIRNRFGDATIDATNEKILRMQQEEWNDLQELEELLLRKLKEAFEQGNPCSTLAYRVCELHKEWLCLQWKEGTYSKEAHLALAEGYVADERFTAYYDKVGKGCTRFLRDAIKNYATESGNMKFE